MTASRALGATGTLPTKRYPIESEAPNRGPLFMSPKPLRAAHLFPIDPMTVLAPSQHQEDERAAEAKAEAAARPLVSCKALVMCRLVRCLTYLVGGILCTLVQSCVLKQVLPLGHFCSL